MTKDDQLAIALEIFHPWNGEIQTILTTPNWARVINRGENIKIVSKRLWRAGDCRYIADIATLKEFA